MIKLLAIKSQWAVLLYALLDLLCIGLGMGMPIFCLLFGLPVGWFIARKVSTEHQEVEKTLRDILKWASFTSGFTFLIMFAIWGWSVSLLFDPSAELANFGMPLLLYEPKASFIGWLVLMIFISPFLQLLMTVFGAHLTLLWQVRREAVYTNWHSVS